MPKKAAAKKATKKPVKKYGKKKAAVAKEPECKRTKVEFQWNGARWVRLSMNPCPKGCHVNLPKGDNFPTGMRKTLTCTDK